MPELPPSPDLSHLKREATRLLRAARAGDDTARQRILHVIKPGHKGPEALRLYHAQRAVARDYGCPTWAALKERVAWIRADLRGRQATWAGWAYGERKHERERAVAALRWEPDLLAGDAILACAIGDEAAIAAVLERDPGWVNQPGGPKRMPPLVAVTHSPLIRHGFETGLLGCARLLLANGADPNAAWTDPRFPDSPLSALYGAAGRNHGAAMTALLLEAGADPNDGESLHHAVESPDLACADLLLKAGARVDGSNAVGRCLDYDNLPALALLLEGRPYPKGFLHHAVLRGRSLAHVRALLDAGADAQAEGPGGIAFWRWAEQNGRADVIALLRKRGIAAPPLTVEDRFVAACARGDAVQARTILNDSPDIVARLPESALEALPRSAAQGNAEAVALMLALGWPREVKTGWGATALNHAVMRGDAALTTLLLRSGADWRTPHGFGNTVIGTLSFASQADETDSSGPGDFPACAAALLEGGVPASTFRGYSFSPEVEDVLAAFAADDPRPAAPR